MILKFKKWLFYRLVQSILVIFGVSVVIFIIARIMPGDPVTLAVGTKAPPEVIEEMRASMNLDKPIYMQYLIWLKNIFKGNFGYSLFTKRNVLYDVKQYLPATLELVLCSGVFMGLMGIILGTISAQNKNSWIDNIVRLIAYIGVVVPPFVLAILFLLIFGYWFQVMPTSGRIALNITEFTRITGFHTIDSLLAGNIEAFISSLKHLILPALSLSFTGLAQEARITRSTMIDNLEKDYILAHKTYGIPKLLIMYQYLLKPSFIPTISVFGLDLSVLLSNAFLVEMIFNWPGLSRYGINVILTKDLNAIVMVVIIFGVAFTIANIIVDLIVTYLDPRITLGGDV